MICVVTRQQPSRERCEVTRKEAGKPPATNKLGSGRYCVFETNLSFFLFQDIKRVEGLVTRNCLKFQKLKYECPHSSFQVSNSKL